MRQILKVHWPLSSFYLYSSFTSPDNKAAANRRNPVSSSTTRRKWQTIRDWMRSGRRTGTKVSLIQNQYTYIPFPLPLVSQFVYNILDSRFLSSHEKIIPTCLLPHRTEPLLRCKNEFMMNNESTRGNENSFHIRNRNIHHSCDV